jgi:hypothetical protein
MMATVIMATTPTTVTMPAIQIHTIRTIISSSIMTTMVMMHMATNKMAAVMATMMRRKSPSFSFVVCLLL